MISEWKAAVGGCVGLCAGDGCTECVRLADLVTWVKGKQSGAERDAWLLIVGDRVADVMGVRRG